MTAISSTSLAAHASISKTDLEEKVLMVIEAAGARGCISDDVQECYPHLSYSSVTARFSALEEKGEIFRNGDTRPGRSGRQQKVMRHIKFAATTPIVRPAIGRKGGKGKRPPFLAGMMYAARLVAKAPDFATAKRNLKRELEKAAKR